MARKAKTCIVEGCDGKYVARGYCMKHYQQKRYTEMKSIRKRPSGRRRYDKEEIRPLDYRDYREISFCCDALCREGEKHDYGKMYCTRCGDPCYWQWVHKNDRKNTR